MDEKKIISDNVIILPRGGYLIDTSLGYIQFGAPPETIKDTMRMPKSVPQYFVLPSNFFNWIKGISIAELEFPIYYNFFLKKKKTYIICSEEQYQRFKKVLQEALFGPKIFNISNDYIKNFPAELMPDIRKEMSFFRNNLKLRDLVAVGILKDGKFKFKNIKIELDSLGNFDIFEHDNFLSHVPGKIDYKPKYKIGKRLAEPFNPPLFGVTCLGPSHGFDPEENTSGFIIWLNHQGIMVDPPVNSTEWLNDSNVNPKFINSIILTHCHADHDAGTFQKILEEGKITIYTTRTVLGSFIKKYSSLIDVSEKYLMSLFDFHPVQVGRPSFINGGMFNFFYTLHSIPTVGFQMKFQDQSFVYSSDHNNDPELHKKLFDEKVISQERYNELSNFPWDSKVIYHESGIPPLHTPIKYLDSLSKSIKKRTVVYHIAKKDFPKRTHLTLAKFGIENTLYFKTSSPKFEEAYQVLGLLKHLDFFNDLPIEKAQDFLDIVEKEHHKKGSLIIKKGSIGDKFYIIYSGNISVDSGNLENKKIYGAYDYFGEVALITEQNRAADVIAATDVIVYTVKKDKFLNFIVGTEFEKTLLRLANIRSSETWDLLSLSSFFKYCTSSQKTWLESIFIPMEITKPGMILKEGDPIEYIYIINKGFVEVTKNKKFVANIQRGDVIGLLNKVHKNEPAGYSFYNTKPVSLFAMKKEDITLFAENNPGLLMKLVYDFEKE